VLTTVFTPTNTTWRGPTSPVGEDVSRLPGGRRRDADHLA
jgi:hypothetical protein